MTWLSLDEMSDKDWQTRLLEGLVEAATDEDLDQRDSQGNTALHYAYAFCHVSSPMSRRCCEVLTMCVQARASSLLEEAMDDAVS